MPDYVDLLITDNDLTLDAGGEPQLIFDRECIVQDIKHCIRDSGLIVVIVGERDPVKVGANLQDLTLLIEDDLRLVPGTVEIVRQETELFFITATTEKYGTVNLEVAA